jgi:hypothetical protein
MSEGENLEKFSIKENKQLNSYKKELTFNNEVKNVV